MKNFVLAVLAVLGLAVSSASLVSSAQAAPYSFSQANESNGSNN